MLVGHEFTSAGAFGCLRKRKAIYVCACGGICIWNSVAVCDKCKHRKSYSKKIDMK